jgi:hypothetical protein
MKKLVLVVAMLLAAVAAQAQVRVEIRFDGEQYIANEPLIAQIRIVNDSGVTLHLGDDPEWLGFAIETMEGPYARQIRLPNVLGAFDLESSHTATKRVDLAPCFNLTQSGKYKIVATAKVPAFKTSFASPSKIFYIVSGSRMWEKQFGVPPNISPADANGLPELRKYILIQAFSGKETKFYIRVTDAQENNIRVVPIGTLISFSKPEPQLDKWSNLHVLYQIGARSFLYTVVNPDGLLISREIHEITDTRPTMAENEEGHIVIKGGARRPSVDDVPPFDAALLPDPVSPTNAPATNKPSGKKAAAANAKDKKKS